MVRIQTYTGTDTRWVAHTRTHSAEENARLRGHCHFRNTDCFDSQSNPDLILHPPSAHSPNGCGAKHTASDVFPESDSCRYLETRVGQGSLLEAC